MRALRRTPARPGTAPSPRPSGRRGVPPLLADAAAWSWRLLLLAALAYLTVRFLALIWLVVVPVLAALLFTALLHPPYALLRRALPRTLAATVTLVASVAAVGGVGMLIERRVSSQLPVLTAETIETVHRLGDGLRVLGVGQVGLDQLQTTISTWVQDHSSQLAGYLGTGAGYLVEFLTFTVLTVFVTFCLLYDGDRIWRWLLSPLRPEPAQRAERAGQLAWTTLARYIRGTAIIAVIHTVIIGGTLLLLHVPLAAPLAVLVFIGSFIPVVGAFVAGGLAVLVTLGTQGWAIALIMLAVLVVDDQLEAHVLQPVIIGRHVRLHPLAIGLTLATGSILGGVIGAIASVPVAAIVHRSLPALLDPAPADPSGAPAARGHREPSRQGLPT